MTDSQVIKLRLSLMGRPVRNYAFEKPVIVVGRDPGADVYVDNPGVSRDHFRLERTEHGEYQIVDLGSANGTFVNDQMVNTSIVHNNDVVRFGKYTLWVGYEADRRTAPRDGQPVATAVTEVTGHTVVLSRAELGSILDQDKRKGPAKVISAPEIGAPVASARSAARPAFSWAVFMIGLALGAVLGAVGMWLYFQR